MTMVAGAVYNLNLAHVQSLYCSMCAVGCLEQLSLVVINSLKFSTLCLLSQ